MRDAFFDFLDEPKDSPRRTRNGIYENYAINLGKEILCNWKYQYNKGNLKISFILLDTRFDKDPEINDMLGKHAHYLKLYHVTY